MRKDVFSQKAECPETRVTIAPNYNMIIYSYA